MRQILRTARTSLGVLLASAGVVTLAGLMTPAQPAYAASVALNATQGPSCTTTHTYTHKVTSAGSQSWEWVTRTACGRAYQRWELLTERSYTGSHYTERVYRDERRYPHYVQQTWKDAFSKHGAETRTYTIKTG